MNKNIFSLGYAILGKFPPNEKKHIWTTNAIIIEKKNTFKQ